MQRAIHPAFRTAFCCLEFTSRHREWELISPNISSLPCIQIHLTDILSIYNNQWRATGTIPLTCLRCDWAVREMQRMHGYHCTHTIVGLLRLCRSQKSANRRHTKVGFGSFGSTEDAIFPFVKKDFLWRTYKDDKIRQIDTTWIAKELGRDSS